MNGAFRSSLSRRGVDSKWEGENWKLDESCISNPKSEIANWTHGLRDVVVQFRISDSRCRTRPISKFPAHLSSQVSMVRRLVRTVHFKLLPDQHAVRLLQQERAK